MDFYIIKRQKSSKYVGMIESRKGLVACTVPNPSKKYAEDRLKQYAHKLKISDINLQDNGSKFAEFIFHLDEDLSKHWFEALEIDLDYQLLTEKQKIVAETLRKLPLGNVMSYGELAKEAGLPRSARFVGNCMANNPLPLLIPCHRVIKSDGSIGEYSAGGPNIKRYYLLKEGYSTFRK